MPGRTPSISNACRGMGRDPRFNASAMISKRKKARLFNGPAFVCHTCRRVLRHGEPFALYLAYGKTPLNPLRARVCERCMATDGPSYMRAQEWVRALPSLPVSGGGSRSHAKRILRLPFLAAFVFLVVTRLTSCYDARGARKALIDAGYHPIRVGGYGWACCGQDDAFSTRFEAWSPDSSRRVSGCVCRGWLKGSTIRLD